MLYFSRGRRGHYVFPDEYPPMSRDVFTVAAFRSAGNITFRIDCERQMH